jgi:hypothetical protein
VERCDGTRLPLSFFVGIVDPSFPLTSGWTSAMSGMHMLPVFRWSNQALVSDSAFAVTLTIDSYFVSFCAC